MVSATAFPSSSLGATKPPGFSLSSPAAPPHSSSFCPPLAHQTQSDPLHSWDGPARDNVTHYPFFFASVNIHGPQRMIPTDICSQHCKSVSMLSASFSSYTMKVPLCTLLYNSFYRMVHTSVSVSLKFCGWMLHFVNLMCELLEIFKISISWMNETHIGLSCWLQYEM